MINDCTRMVTSTDTLFSFFFQTSGSVSSPWQQRWVVDASNNVISISCDASDTSSVSSDTMVTTNNDAEVSLPRLQVSSRSDDIASVAAAAVDYVISKVDNGVTKRSNNDVLKSSDDATRSDGDDNDDDVTIIGDITIPQDQRQLLSLYSNPGVAGGGRQHHPPPERTTQIHVCEICGRNMKSSVAVKLHKLHVHKIG